MLRTYFPSLYSCGHIRHVTAGRRAHKPLGSWDAAEVRLTFSIQKYLEHSTNVDLGNVKLLIHERHIALLLGSPDLSCAT